MLNLSAESFERVLKSMPGCIVVMDKAAVIVMVNNVALELLGFNELDLIGKPFKELLFKGSVVDDADRFVNDLVKNGNVSQVQISFMSKEGERIPLLFSASHIYDEDGTQLIMCSAMDISDIETASETVLTSRDSAVKSAKIRSDYLARISHEIKNHMNAVAGMTNLLSETVELDDEHKEFIDAVHKSSTWMLSLVNDILDFSKIEVGKIKIEQIDFDLRPTLEGIRQMFAQNAKEKGVKLVCLVHSNLPIVVQGDPWRLRQILINLTGNALKFTENGDVIVQAILVKETETHATVRFSVDDTGIGIPGDKINRLFKPYVQIDKSSSSVDGGTGLGLAISKQLCEMMGGEIGVESEEGEGAKFWFTIELGKQNVVRPMIPLSAEEIADLKVAIFVDKDVNIKILSSYFSSWGCKNSGFQNRETLLDNLRDEENNGNGYNLLVLDCHDPDEHVIELGRIIKNDVLLKKIEIVLLASTAKRGDAKNVENAGFAAFITKPITKSQLFNCVAAVMGFKQDKSNELITRHSLSEHIARNSARLLLVDDNIANQMMTVVLLEHEGFHVNVANNGKEAVETLQDQFYDIVLMDCCMPVMDGYEATKAIRSLNCNAKHVPIVALTATDVSDGAREKCFNAGMDDYITKPYDKSHLLQIIHKWIDDDFGTEEFVAEENLEDDEEGVIFDREAALCHVDGDASLLYDIIQQFLEDCPKHLQKIKEGIDKRKRKELVHSVHALKSLVGNLYAKPAFKTVSQFEAFANAEKFDLIEDGFQHLQNQIKELVNVFESEPGLN